MLCLLADLSEFLSGPSAALRKVDALSLVSCPKVSRSIGARVVTVASSFDGTLFCLCEFSNLIGTGIDSLSFSSLFYFGSLCLKVRRRRERLFLLPPSSSGIRPDPMMSLDDDVVSSFG